MFLSLNNPQILPPVSPSMFLSYNKLPIKQSRNKRAGLLEVLTLNNPPKFCPSWWVFAIHFENLCASQRLDQQKIPSSEQMIETTTYTNMVWKLLM